MNETFSIRRATVADAAVVAHHRAAMFRDMGRADAECEALLRDASNRWLEGALARGEYLGWLAEPHTASGTIVSGAGVQVRQVLPFPQCAAGGADRVAEGRQAIVVNVYTDPAFRRRGLARRLMVEILAWAASVSLDSLVLHAAPDGRPLYESLGFVPTNEMRYGRSLIDPPPVVSARRGVP